MPHRRTARKFAIAVLALLGLGLTGLNPSAARGDAGAFVKELGDRAIRMLTVKELSAAEREDRFRALLREGFDVQRIGRFVLGRYVRQITPEEMEEYQRLFEDLIVVTYAARFGEYSGQTFAVQRVAGPEGTSDAVVMTTITPSEGGPPIRVDWQVRKTDRGFKIVDVRVEGVSMSVTQRDEFTAVIQQNGGKVGALITALRDKTSGLKSR